MEAHDPLKVLEDMLSEAGAVPMLSLTPNQWKTVVGNMVDKLVRTKKALEDLHNAVWRECPRLLDEGSGGNTRLDLEIRKLLDGR